MKKCLLLTAIVFLLACPALAKTPSQANATPEEYVVYDALIANMFAGEKVTFDTQGKVNRVVIQDATTAYSANELDDQYFKRMFPTLGEGVGEDYYARNKKSVRLRDIFNFNVKYILVTKSEIDKIFKGGSSWDEFYRRYPDSGGFIILSRVGFNAAMNQALVYIQHGCGGLCGTGHFVLLEKSDDRWKVVKRSMIWIS